MGGLARRLRFGMPALVLMVMVGDLQAGLRFVQPVVDAGTVRGGAPLVQTYDFVNEGPDPVLLTGARVSCGCLTPQLEKRVYQPGEKGAIALEVHTLSQPAGPNAWFVHVSYQENAAVREVPLELKARVIKDVLVQPAVMTVFADGPVHHEIRLTDHRSPPLLIRDVRTTSERLEARAASAGAAEQLIRVQVPADCPVGQHFEAVAIYTDDPAYPELRVPVTIVKRPRQAVMALPAEISMVGQAGQPLPSRLVLIRDADDRRVVVDQVTADDPAISCRFATGPENNVTVRIQLDADRMMGGGLDSAVRVQLSRPVPETLIIPVRCTLQTSNPQGLK
jgi:hypothetical protein